MGKLIPGVQCYVPGIYIYNAGKKYVVRHASSMVVLVLLRACLPACLHALQQRVVKNDDRKTALLMVLVYTVDEVDGPVSLKGLRNAEPF